MPRWRRNRASDKTQYLDALFDQGNRRIGGNFVKHHVLGTTRGQRISQVFEQTQLRDDAVCDDEDFGVPETRNGLPQTPT